MRPPAFVDPREVKPVHLDRAALELLLENGLELAPRSELHALFDESDDADAAAREKASTTLAQRGLLPLGAAREGTEGALLGKSLQILASPDAEVQLESRLPGQTDDASEVRTYFLAGDGVAPVTWVEDGLLLHAALRADAFATQLSKLFQPSSPPKDFVPLALNRSQVEAARLLWGEGRGASESISREAAIDNAERFDDEGGNGSALIDLLIAGEVLVEHRGELSLAPRVKDALAAIWSGESHELVVRDLDDDASPEDPEGLGLASFYVAGVAGQRVIIDVSEALDEDDASVTPEDPDEALDTEVVQFTWLTREELNQSLEALLGL